MSQGLDRVFCQGDPAHATPGAMDTSFNAPTTGKSHDHWTCGITVDQVRCTDEGSHPDEVVHGHEQGRVADAVP